MKINANFFGKILIKIHFEIKDDCYPQYDKMILIQMKKNHTSINYCFNIKL